MKLQKLLITGSVLALSIASANVMAKVSAEEAARLGKDLTPVGAEKAGNGGRIPEWTGGITEIPKGYKGDGKYVDPFPNDKPEFVITHANAQQYKDNLSPGQLAMLAKYPNSYKIPVFQTRRSASYRPKDVEATKKNAVTVEITASKEGMTGYEGGYPFPIPHGDSASQANQIIWNHAARPFGDTTSRIVGQVTPLANGSFSVVRFKEDIVMRPALADYNAAKGNNIIFYLKQEIISPARLSGNVLLVHETIDQVKEPRLAWVYNAGQRRVRRAPQVAYDGPGTASDGMRTTDNFDMFNGARDRYDWKVVGKKEMYIPYNSYRISDTSLKYNQVVKPGHLNPDYTRYELHRVWHVQATLKSDQRHIYAKRDFFVDEDSWQIAIADNYDGRGDLWRVQEAHKMNYYDVRSNRYAVETVYDLLSGRYLALGLTNEEEPNTFTFGIKRSEADFTPAALRQSGVR